MPVKVKPEVIKGDPPVLVTVTCCDTLVAPTVSLPNDTLLADRDIVVERYPVPAREIVCCVALVLSWMVTAAVSAPALAGVKCP